MVAVRTVSVVTSACLAVVAALGASFLTGLAALGVTAFREWLGGRAADRDALDAAVTEMLSRSMGISLRANTMAHTMRLRSGLGEGIDVLTHHRKPLDPLEFHDWLAQDQAPLNASWSVIWARGNQETIRRANALLAACTDLTGAGTSIQAAATLRQRLKRNVVGSTWTEKNARPSATPCGSLPTPVRTP